jgi:hypothetical protein
MKLTKKETMAIEAESRHVTDGDLYRYLKCVGNDPTKSEIESALKQVLDDKTFRTVVAVFRLSTQDVDCDAIAKAYQDEWLLGSEASNGNFYLTRDGSPFSVSSDITRARSFVTDAEAVMFANSMEKPLVNPFVRRRKNCK